MSWRERRQKVVVTDGVSDLFLCVAGIDNKRTKPLQSRHAGKQLEERSLLAWNAAFAPYTSP